MSAINTGLHPKLLWPGIKELWGQKYNEHPKEYTQLFDMETSTQNYEEEQELTNFSLVPQKTEGSSVVYQTLSQGITKRFVHLAYASGYIIVKEELDDNLYLPKSRRYVPALAFAATQTKENVAANVYNRAFSSSYPGADGVALLSASHPVKAGTQSNLLAVAADLSEASLEDLCVQIMNAKNSSDMNISLMPKCLIVAPANAFEAERILESTLQNDTGNNATNALKSMGIIPKVVINHYLTDTDAWFIRTNAPRGMIGYDRIKIQFEQDNDFDTKNAKASCYERYSFGQVDFRSLYGSQGA